MKNILLVRHAQTDWNINSRFQGVSDVPINDKGISQANKIAKKLSKFKIDEIHSSTLKRAYITAEKIAQFHDVNITTHKDLIEVSFGSWEGKTKDEILSLGYKDVYKEWKRTPETVVLPGNNTLQKVQKKASKCLKRIIDNTDNDNILIVSHGAVLKLIIMDFLNLDISLYKHFWLGNTSLSILKIKENKCTLDLLNDMCHLGERNI